MLFSHYVAHRFASSWIRKIRLALGLIGSCSTRAGAAPIEQEQLVPRLTDNAVSSLISCMFYIYLFFMLFQSTFVVALIRRGNKLQNGQSDSADTL